MGTMVEVPVSLKHPLFFLNDLAQLPANSSLLQPPYFVHELLYDREGSKPWEEAGAAESKIDVLWKELNVELEVKFAERNKEVHIQMKAAIALFLMRLFWSNHRPVVLNDWVPEVEKLPAKPVNVKERLEFIFRRPYSYHAFVQIGELMTEQKKQLAKYKIINKKK